MTIVKTGDRLKNNDPRAAGKIVTVKAIRGELGAVDKSFAMYHTGRRWASVRLDRIFEIGETNGHQGWTLLPRDGIDVAA